METWWKWCRVSDDDHGGKDSLSRHSEAIRKYQAEESEKNINIKYWCAFVIFVKIIVEL